MTETPSPFSQHNPKLQIAWDSTSFKALLFCPKYYEYTIIDGWKAPNNVDLEFGIMYHSACEEFDKALLRGLTREEAQFIAVKHALLISGRYYNPEDGCYCTADEDTTGCIWVPWGGEYILKWRCEGKEKYKNAKGNTAKCPYSHAGKWFVTEAPALCGECGGSIDVQEKWESFEPKKDRYTFIRAICWYTEEDSAVKPYAFPNGEAAVELPFRLPFPHQNKYWETTVLCGYLDGIAQFGSEHFVRDRKTTKGSLSKKYYAGFSPNIQFDIYDLAGSMLYPELNLRGVLLDACATGITQTQFGFHPCTRNPNNREELMEDITSYLHEAEGYAEADHWPRNRNSCWLCDFKEICSMEESGRKRWLGEKFVKQHWNPLEER